MRELAVVVSNDNENINIKDTIDIIKKSGFKNVFVQWYNKDWNPSQEEQLDYIKSQNLNVIFAHLGYQNINDIWLENEEGDKLVERYKNDIKICKENNIPLVVMHLSSKNEALVNTEIGIKRIQEIADYAESIDMKIAFENTKIKGNLEFVLDRIKNKNVGVCFDSGHCHAHFNDDFDFAKFKDRIFAVHLHDNDTSRDQHKIPFDGTIDWKNIVKNLKENNYAGPVTMELVYAEFYADITADEFYKKGFEAGEKLANMFEE